MKILLNDVRLSYIIQKGGRETSLDVTMMTAYAVFNSLMIKILLLVSLFVPSAFGIYDMNQPSGLVPGRFIVKFSKNADPARFSQSLSKSENLNKLIPEAISAGTVGLEEWDKVYVFTDASKSQSEKNLISRFGSENIEYIEQDCFLQLLEYPRDSLFHHQWYLNNTGQEYYSILRRPGDYDDTLVLVSGEAERDIRLQGYYENPPSEATKVVVAVIDTGVDYLHPELEGRIWKNPDEIPGNNVDDDHNGYIDDTLGYDISGDEYELINPQSDNDPADNIGHGSHIAGIIAANIDNRGVAGIAPNACIMPVKIFPNGTSSIGARGVVYAITAGAKIINISWGSNFNTKVLDDALRMARDNDVLVTIAAGNSGDNSRFYPAAYDSAFVVGAGNSSGGMTYFSTYGAHIDIIAPGQDILSIRGAGTDMYADSREPLVRIIGDDSLYYLSDGTSMAAPVVAGASALIWSIRPDLSLDAMVNVLLRGATDIIDPLARGDTLIGPDTICGYGYLNIDASLGLIQDGGIYIAEPQNRNRYAGDLSVKAAPLGSYAGSWRLEYSPGFDTGDWNLLAAGEHLPPDSIIYNFDENSPVGIMRLRLTDKNDRTSQINITRVFGRKVDIISPANYETVKYYVPLIGSVYGDDYDSLAVHYKKDGSLIQHLVTLTGEFYDSTIYNWSFSGSDTGLYSVYLNGYFDGEIIMDSLIINVASAFSSGWPKSFEGNSSISPVSCDLDRDGQKEIILGVSTGLYMWEYDGSAVRLADGFPVMENIDMRCVPAIYDIDGDNEDEIICTNETGLHVFNRDGSYADGWPRGCETGAIPYGFGYPNPTVTKLEPDGDSVIMFINKIGQIFAYKFNGDPHFFSRKGLYSAFESRISNSWSKGGDTSPLVTAADLDGDGTLEVVAKYTSPNPYSGLGVFEGRTGRPAFGRNEAEILRLSNPYGIVLADLDNNNRLEVAMLSYDSNTDSWINIMTNGTENFPGWPVMIEGRNLQNWGASYLTAADLDLDGIPELLCTFYSWSTSALHIFKADGSPYIEYNDRPVGEVLVDQGLFSTPLVANLTGDEYPEIIFRSGNLLPGSGPEKIYVLDYKIEAVPGFPLRTPASPGSVLFSRYAPVVDDIDGDGLVELLFASDGKEVLVWDFDASYDEGRNRARIFYDNLNSGIMPACNRRAIQNGGEDD